MKIIGKILNRLDFSSLRFRKKVEPKEEEKPSLLKDIFDNPEVFKLEAFIENDEVVIKIRRKDEP